MSLPKDAAEWAVLAHELEFAEELPVETLEDVEDGWDAFQPHVLSVVAAAARDPEAWLDEHEFTLLIAAVSLLAFKRDAAAAPPMTSLLRLPPEDLDELLGDFAFDGLDRCVASVTASQPSVLDALLDDPRLSDLGRSAAVGAVVAQAVAGDRTIASACDLLLRAGERIAFERRGPEHAEAPDIISIADGLLALDPEATQGAVRAWEANGVLVDDFVDWSFVEHSVQLPVSERLARFGTGGYVSDVMEFLAPWYDTGDADDDVLDDDEREVQVPFVRELPKLGRNDPCRCGSGKKYKKCCLRSE